MSNPSVPYETCTKGADTACIVTTGTAGDGTGTGSCCFYVSATTVPASTSATNIARLAA